MPLKETLKNIFYKPRVSRLLIDFLAWSISIGAMLIWRVSTEKFIVLQYVTMFFYVYLLWRIAAHMSNEPCHIRENPPHHTYSARFVGLPVYQ